MALPLLGFIPSLLTPCCRRNERRYTSQRCHVLHDSPNPLLICAHALTIGIIVCSVRVPSPIPFCCANPFQLSTRLDTTWHLKQVCNRFGFGRYECLSTYLLMWPHCFFPFYFLLSVPSGIIVPFSVFTDSLKTIQMCKNDHEGAVAIRASVCTSGFGAIFYFPPTRFFSVCQCFPRRMLYFRVESRVKQIALATYRWITSPLFL